MYHECATKCQKRQYNGNVKYDFLPQWSDINTAFYKHSTNHISRYTYIHMYENSLPMQFLSTSNLKIINYRASQRVP